MITLPASSSSPLADVSFKETIDSQILIKMLLSNEVLNVSSWKVNGRAVWFENERGQVIEILKLMCKSPNHKKILDTHKKDIDALRETLSILYHHAEVYLKPSIFVKYHFNTKDNCIGRVYAEKSMSLGCFRRELRHHIARGKYLDIDVVNAHFIIADQIFNRDRIQFPVLREYVINRNTYLSSLGKHFAIEGYLNGLDYTNETHYDALKSLFIRVLYFGEYASWCRDNDLPDNLDPPGWLLQLKDEFTSIATLIKDANPHLLAKATSENKYNIDGTICSWFFQEWERRILESLYEFFHKKKQIKKRDCVLCFDGIMIIATEQNNNAAFLKKLLEDASDSVYKDHSIRITLKHKVFDNTQYESALHAIDIPYVDDKTLIIEDKDDLTATRTICESIGDDMVFCNGKHFLKINNIWICDKRAVDAHLLRIVMESGIKTTSANGTIKCYAQYTSNAKHIVDDVKNHYTSYPNDDFYKNFHSSTEGKLCFTDGVLFFKENCFRLWSDPFFDNNNNKVYSTVAIPRKFADVFASTKAKDSTQNDLTRIIDDIEIKVFRNVLDDQTDRFLQVFSRAIAGHIRDKNWTKIVGERDCGKGTITSAMRNAFSGYIGSINSSCLMQTRFTSTDTKENSWMIDEEFHRVSFAEEFDDKEVDGKATGKINGTKIKSCNSGGDIQTARKNFQDEIKFIFGAMLCLVMNPSNIEVKPADALQTCHQFTIAKSFKTKQWVENRRAALREVCADIEDPIEITSIMTEMDRYLEADDDVKLNCANSIIYANAIVLLFLKYYSNTKITPPMDIDSDSSTGDVDDVVNKNLIITKKVSDFLSNTELKELHQSLYTSIPFLRFKKILIARGCTEGRDISHKYRGLTGVQSRVIDTSIETFDAV